MVLADVTPALAAEAIALRQELEQTATLSRLQSGAVLQMEAALSEVQTARASLAAAVAERREAPDRFALSEDALRQIVEAVDTLDAFLDLLAQAPAPEDSAMRGFSDARGAVPLPVLLNGFEAQDAAGVSRPGLLLATAPAALVTSPWFGTVRYAGPLLDYGNVVILEPEGI
jgi:septal ring factor EnvC (AmiA/AmiB activator)